MDLVQASCNNTLSYLLLLSLSVFHCFIVSKISIWDNWWGQWGSPWCVELSWTFKTIVPRIHFCTDWAAPANLNPRTEGKSVKPVCWLIRTKIETRSQSIHQNHFVALSSALSPRLSPSWLPLDQGGTQKRQHARERTTYWDLLGVQTQTDFRMKVSALDLHGSSLSLLAASRG